MRTEQEQLTTLRLRQARRKELPWYFLKAIVLFAGMVFASGMATNCGASHPEKPLTPEQKAENKQQLWGNHKKAHSARLP
jgi:hypothetical protein